MWLKRIERPHLFAIFYGVTGAWRCMLAHEYGTNLHCSQLGSWTSWWSSIWSIRAKTRSWQKKGNQIKDFQSIRSSGFLISQGWMKRSVHSKMNGTGPRSMLQVYRMNISWIRIYIYIYIHIITQKRREKEEANGTSRGARTLTAPTHACTATPQGNRTASPLR